MPPGRGKGRVKKLHKSSKGEKKAARSHNGFVVGALGFLGLLCVTLGGAIKEHFRVQKRSKDVRERLASKQLVYSQHSTCRMDCRHITQKDVHGVLKRGTLREDKSNVNSAPCPRYAFQDGRVLGVFADCAFDTRVVTVIDTVTDHPCGPC